MMPDLFRYTITYQSIDYVLDHAPDGWDKETLGSYQRSTDYFGLIRTFSLPLRFVLDGAEILKFAYSNDGVEAGAKILIEKRNKNWGYDAIYNGDLDFSSFEYDNGTVSINVMDDGTGKEIKARENTTYEIPISGPDVVNIVLPGVRFDDRTVWSINPTDASDLNVAKIYTPTIDLITQSSSGFIEGFNTQQRNAAPTDGFNGDVFIRGRRASGVSINLKGNVKGYFTRITPFPDRYLFIHLKRASDNALLKVIYSIDTAAYPTGITNFDVDFEYNSTIGNDEGYYIYVGTDSSTSAQTLIINEGQMTATFTSYSDESNCKGFKGLDLFKRLMLRIKPSINTASDLLAIDWKNLIFTSGTAIREIEDPKIKISLKQFFQAINSIDDAGMGNENNILRIERKPFFMRNIQIANIGNVNKCNYTPAEDLIGSLIEIGFDDKNTNDNDGLEEFNSSVQYQMPITRVTNTLDYVSPVLASQYAIEQLRVKFNVKKEATSDTDGDNNTFMIHCNDKDAFDNYRPILGSQLSGVSGLTFPNEAYNLLISPKFNLLRKSGYLRSLCDKLDIRFIEFASAKKNSKLIVNYNGQVYNISQSVPISTLSGKFFRPIIFTVNAKFPRNIMQLMDATPFGYISFNYNSIICKGYIMEINVDLGSNNAQEIKLLAHVDSELP